MASGVTLTLTRTNQPFTKVTPGFGRRTSGTSWYPKKEALDELLDIMAASATGADPRRGGGSGVPRLRPKGRFAQLAVDLEPLVWHAHHMVHTTALAVVKELGRSLRGDFHEQCGGGGVLRLLVMRSAEKKLRPQIHDILDALFASGAVHLGAVADTMLPNLLDLNDEENRPLTRGVVWDWLLR